jgi:hypothetical protein
VYTQVRSDHLADAVSEAGAKEQTRRKALAGQRLTVAVRREDEVSLHMFIIQHVFYSCCIFFIGNFVRGPFKRDINVYFEWFKTSL